MAECSTRRRPRRDDHSSNSGADMSHPVFNRISQVNGRINKLTKNQIQDELRSFHLNACGTKDVVKKRLKIYYKNRFLVRERFPTEQTCSYKYLVVIDFEATCDAANPDNYPHEIIEFPAVVIDTDSEQIVAEFTSFVRPINHPYLTDFCTNLTGITQNMVDEAPPFNDVLSRFETWLKNRNFHNDMAIVTDGPSDIARFMYLQCITSKLDFPKWAKRWINMKKIFSNFYGVKKTNIDGMLQALGLQFEGQLHSGIDDSRNIATIILKLLEDGAQLKINEELHNSKRQHLNQLRRVRRAEEADRNQYSYDSDNDCSDPGACACSPYDDPFCGSEYHDSYSYVVDGFDELGLSD